MLILKISLKSKDTGQRHTTSKSKTKSSTLCLNSYIDDNDVGGRVEGGGRWRANNCATVAGQHRLFVVTATLSAGQSLYYVPERVRV